MDCDRIKRKRRAAFKKWTYTKDPEDCTEYKKLVAIAKKTFKKKKKEYFIKFAESLDSRTNMKYVWNKCRILANKWVKTGDKITTENLQWMNKTEAAMDKLSPPFAATNPEWLPPCPNNVFLSEQFSYTEFNVALESRNTKSSPGIDGNDYVILKQVVTALFLNFVRFFC